MTVPVAIVGIGCRFPGANGPGELWQNLIDGKDAIRDVPADRWDPQLLHGAESSQRGELNPRWGGFIDDIAGFDSDFFSISDREASRMDPQQRIALEVAWEALEDAGVPAADIAETPTGVYMGVSTYDHGAALHSDEREVEPYDGTGGALSIVANRISYCFNLRGPSLAVDTACSSSLVAVQLACQAIRGEEIDLAIAGGVNVIVSPEIALSFSKGGLMASDGRCKSFDHRADGYVRSEGSGVVILKPLERAIEDGDRIYAVALGGAVNQDGRTNGLTAPSRLAQESVLAAAYVAAGVDPTQVAYVEAHGTGTAVGDPIEVAALGSVLGSGRGAQRRLRIGSVKSNLGHLEAAAGAAGLIKVALSLHHERIPPSIHFEQANPMLGLDRLNIEVESVGRQWPEEAGPRFAGVSSFGFGGTNAHLVLASAPAANLAVSQAPPGEPCLVPISARSLEALHARARGWARAAPDADDDPGWLPQVAATAALRSDHHPVRAAVVASDSAELAHSSEALVTKSRATGGQCGPRRTNRRRLRAVLVFPGQGSQWMGMGRILARSSPVFRAAIERCAQAIADRLGTTLWSREAGLSPQGTAEVQPALFAIQVALAETWRAWGLEPAAVIGHSMGEIAAAHVAGALSLEDAVAIVCERSRLLTEISGEGGLALVELAMDEAAKLIEGRERDLSLAAANGPRATVLSGTYEALDAIERELDDHGVFVRRIAVDFAAHSPAVEQLQPRLRAAIAEVSPRDAPTPFYSTVTGGLLSSASLDASYWVRNVREPVLFAPTVEALLLEGVDAFVEVAPHPVLERSIVQVIDQRDADAAVIPSLRRDDDEFRGMLRALGDLYTRGLDVAWETFHGSRLRPAAIPPHGWNHKTFPPATSALHRASGDTGAERGEADGDGLLGARIRVGADPSLLVWSLPLDLAHAPELDDHRVEETAVVPAAYWLSAATEALATTGAPDVLLDQVDFLQLKSVDQEGAALQLGLRPTDDEAFSLTITSYSEDDEPVLHARGVARRADAPDAAPAGAPHLESGATDVSGEGYYASLAEAGLQYGSSFRGLADLRVGHAEAVGRIVRTEPLWRSPLPLHPATLDACLHVVGAAVDDLPPNALPLPARVERVVAKTSHAPFAQGWCHARIVKRTDVEVVAELTVTDDSGDLVWSAHGFAIRLTQGRRRPEEGRLYDLRWQPLKPELSPKRRDDYLIFPETVVGRSLAERLTADGSRVTVTEAPPSSEALEQATDVVDMRAVASHDTPLTLDSLAESCGRALKLVQDAARCSRPPRVWLTTAGTQEASGTGEATGIAAAPLWGLARVAANERPDCELSLIELRPDPSGRELDLLARVLRCDSPPEQAAIRGGELLSPRLAPLAVRPSLSALSGDGTYLVTGGAGAVGLNIAEWLIRRGARNLLLVGRSALTHDLEARLDNLRGHAERVRYERADVADRAALEDVLASLAGGETRLAGVIHAAGVLEDATIQHLDEAPLRRALSGKALGAWNLHLATRELPLELFVMISSLAGVIGSPGQAAYAAANSFLDSLAALRIAEGLPALSIDYGPWSGDGLAAGAGGLERLAERGVPPLDPGVAVELLDGALAAGRPQVVAAAFDLDALARSAASAPSARSLIAEIATRPAADDETASKRAEILALDSSTERQRAMTEFVTEEVAGVLRVPDTEVQGELPFEDLGFDSMMAIELRDRLEAKLDLRLSAAALYSHPTPNALAEALLERIAADASTSLPQADEETALTDETDDDLSSLEPEELAALVGEELDRLDEARSR